MQEDIAVQAKAIITEEVERMGYRVLRVFLFGSRARGSAWPDSDRDFFGITNREPAREEKQAITTRLSLRFAELGFYQVPGVGYRVPGVGYSPPNTWYPVPTHLPYYGLKEGVPI
jgi:predicted nucleotidyltransferase